MVVDNSSDIVVNWQYTVCECSFRVETLDTISEDKTGNQESREPMRLDSGVLNRDRCREQNAVRHAFFLCHLPQ